MKQWKSLHKWWNNEIIYTVPITNNINKAAFQSHVVITSK